MITNIHDAIKWHRLDNNGTFKKSNYIYSSHVFDGNQLDL